MLGWVGVNGSNGKDGVNGINGVSGKDGVNGVNGCDGVFGYEVKMWDYIKGGIYFGVGGGVIVMVVCLFGKVAISGGYWFKSKGDNGFYLSVVLDGLGVIVFFFGCMDWNMNIVKLNDNFGWII